MVLQQRPSLAGESNQAPGAVGRAVGRVSAEARFLSFHLPRNLPFLLLGTHCLPFFCHPRLQRPCHPDLWHESPLLCRACQLPLHSCPDTQAAMGCPGPAVKHPAVKHPRASPANPPSYTCAFWRLASCWPQAYSRSGCGVQA